MLSAYERKDEDLKWKKLGLPEKVLPEKTARCTTALGSFNATFRTIFDFLSNLSFKAFQDENEAEVIMAEREGFEQARKTWEFAIKSGEMFDFSPVLAKVLNPGCLSTLW